jgi:PIN domain nuclease of toxin-antitoxin system
MPGAWPDALVVDCDPAFARASRKIIAETKNVILAGAASAWEIATK